MDIRICERRCAEKGECKEYLAHYHASPQAAQSSRQKDAPPRELEAA
jgi:hypothetical protein